MFTFPLEKMVGGIFYEHSHRLIASTVGFLILVLAFWLWRAEPRRWVRRLGFIALGAVITQGVLGGITVLWYLPDADLDRARQPGRRSSSASRRRSRWSRRPDGAAATRAAARVQTIARCRRLALHHDRPSSTCRSLSARRCATPMRGWRSPTSPGCSGT